MSLPQFKIYQVDTGFARIVWKVKNPRNEWIYYCIQDNALTLKGLVPGIGKYEMYRCSQPPVCEPSHRVAHSSMPLAEMLELPRNDGSDMEREIREWILNQ